MATISTKYRVYCQTEEDYFYVWLSDDEGAPTTCPNNNSHTIDTDQTTVMETIEKKDVNVVSSDTTLDIHQHGFVDLTGHNVYRYGFSHVVRAGTSQEFEAKYSATMKLQGLSLRVGNTVNEGSLQLDPEASESNSGTGIITQSLDCVHDIHHRKYTFTIANKSGSSFEVNWESDDDTDGILYITDTNSQEVEVEDDLTLDFAGLDNFANGDVYNLTLDRGDYFEVEMVDSDGTYYPAGTVLVSFAKNIHLVKDWKFECICPDAKDLYNWVYIRVRYVSTYGTDNTIVKFDHAMRTVPT